MAMKFPCFILLLLICFGIKTNAQIEILPTSLHYGTTDPETEWVIDVHIKNNGSKKDFLLRNTFSHEYEVLFTSKTILPDSSIVMRVKFSPRVKGVYKEKIELYFASMNEPIILPVNAMVVYQNPDDHIPCPNFSKQVADCCPDNFFMVEVIDDTDGKGIVGAEVKISEESINRMKLKTLPDGKVSNQIPIGYYGIEATHPEYESAKLESYINHHKAYFKFRLQRKIPQTVLGQDTLALVEQEPEVIPMNAELLDESLYAPNNVVFLLDVSSSMLQGEKLALMKGALQQLTDVLRSQDKITLISYAAEAAVLLQTTTGDQHNQIKAIISELHADGSTSGEKGFKASYEVLRKEFLSGEANNQLVVITDGAFQPEDQVRINKLVKKSSKKGITTSIVGIQCASFANQKLSEVSTIGGGSFLTVTGEEDLQVLIEELKRRSAK